MPFAIVAVLLFTVPDVDDTTMVIYSTSPFPPTTSR
ncbi:Na+/melibiose symporter-like transporter [Pseudonocardia parietis]|uniref:Na+/melibiose symporter-like transporter n=1 Tax=Pseudonocardia parietis TaxID=570936 RepID=A0ABS4VR37_9PSEU|nr:Na+/melibiose symporter-like transporter [Pseudonocardia parietis]